MRCERCGNDLKMGSEFCLRCGHRNVLTVTHVAAEARDESAIRRGDKISAALDWALAALVPLIGFAIGYTILYDRPLIYDGSALPSVSVQGTVTATVPSLEKPYSNPRPGPAMAVKSPQVFGYRRNPIRKTLSIVNLGDTEKVITLETAVTSGLDYLKRQQRSDGGWPVAVLPKEWDQWSTGDFQWSRVGISALALLAFTGNGHAWLPDDRATKPYSEVVLRGARFLSESQDVATGRFGPPAGDGTLVMYNQGLATWAMAEIAGITGDEQTRIAAQRGIDMILKAQTKQGGWNYAGKPDGDDDTSLSAWQVMALVAAKEAGLNVPDLSLQKALNMFTAATKNGRVVYNLQNDDGRETAALTGMGLMMRQMLGEDNKSVVLKRMGARMQREQPQTKRLWGPGYRFKANKADDEERSKYDPYMILFTTYGMFFLGGSDWEAWNAAIKKSVVEMQDTDGAWRLNDMNTQRGGVIYSTALSLLTLQVYYRHPYGWIPKR